MGFWSYSVPEFTWRMFPHGGGETVDMGKFKDWDLVFHEDAGYCQYTNRRDGPPVIYFEIESCFTDAHYKARMQQAIQADLVMIEWSQAFRPAGKKIIRFPFCVNDKIFYPRPKAVDVAWHAATSKVGGEIRKKLTADLMEICNRRGYTLAHGPRAIVDYGASFGAAKVAANQNRLPNIRAHRCFDAMACGAALVTGPTPFTDGDMMTEGEHYLVFRDKDELEKHIDRLLTIDWLEFAERGYNLIMQNHTWAIRAAQLRDIVNREFGI
jgi:hypothetical protein